MLDEDFWAEHIGPHSQIEEPEREKHSFILLLKSESAYYSMGFCGVMARSLFFLEDLFACHLQVSIHFLFAINSLVLLSFHQMTPSELIGCITTVRSYFDSLLAFDKESQAQKTDCHIA